MNLSIDDQNIITNFFKLLEKYEQQTIKTGKWLGISLIKFPTDIMVYQQILFETRPNIIIECGSAYGGSALFYANMFELMKIDGKILSIDIVNHKKVPVVHDMISFLFGSSTDINMVENIKKMIKPTDRVMVVLDSDHKKDHVLKEMQLYSNLVTIGCYMVVEDGGVNGHPVYPKHGPGPYEAIDEFIKINNNYKIDYDRQYQYLFSCHPNGWLKRIS